MLRLLGTVLVATGCAWLGFRSAAVLRNQVRALRDIADGLVLLEQELELDAPPLPQLMERLIPRSRGAARALFQGCRRALDRLEEESFSRSWRQLVEGRHELGPEGRQCLLPLGDTLGRCSCEEQRRTVAALHHRLVELTARAEETCRRQGKVYQVLGLSGGAFLVIILL